MVCAYVPQSNMTVEVELIYSGYFHRENPSSIKIEIPVLSFSVELGDGKLVPAFLVTTLIQSDQIHLPLNWLSVMVVGSLKLTSLLGRANSNVPFRLDWLDIGIPLLIEFSKI